MSNLNSSMILADEASAACNARTYNAATSSKKRSKDGATMTPHSGKNESKLTPSVGKKRRPHIEMKTEGLNTALKGKEVMEFTENLLGHSREIAKATLKERQNIRSCTLSKTISEKDKGKFRLLVDDGNSIKHKVQSTKSN